MLRKLKPAVPRESSRSFQRHANAQSTTCLLCRVMGSVALQHRHLFLADASETKTMILTQTRDRRKQRLLRLLPLVCLSLSVLLVFAGTKVGLAVQPQNQQLARLINDKSSTAIPGQYIIVFKSGTERSDVLSAEKIVERFGGKILFRYTSALIGFNAQLPANALQALRGARGVDWIEADQKVSLKIVQSNPPKGLDRTSERLLPLDNQYTHGQVGQNVNVYVIDSGIMSSHSEFGNRANGPYFDAFGGNGQDCFGHGTHVAGTIGGVTYGIAKNVELHPVRVFDCTGAGSWGTVIAGVDWVTNNAVYPAVANMSLGGSVSPAADSAVTASIASGVTYTVAAGNSHLNANGISPAHVPTAITVGASDPANDTVAAFSNFGPSLDLFAPGIQTLSAWPNGVPVPPGCVVSSTTLNAGAVFCSGTSMAAPHVAGVAALSLQCNAAASPANVWAAIHNADNVSTTSGWPGLINLGTTGSPNELLHWGSKGCDGYDDGDPHITTVNGVRYDFQGAGEFVTLRGGGMEIQKRQTPVATTFNPGQNPHTGLATCVSINTAVAARVGNHRVTFQPNLNGTPDPSGLQLRVDGILTTLGPNGLALGSGARVISSGGGGIEIDFPDGTALIVTPGWWASQSKWYLNISVLHTSASEGIMGAIVPGSWLPALPSGSSLGPKPSSMHQRYVDLNQTFADAWRVTNATSLFDYAPGTSTATFTNRGWPAESGACVVPRNPQVQPVEPRVAQQLCREIVGKDKNADCVFDVTLTGEAGFAKTYLLTQQIQAGSTTIAVNPDKDSTNIGEAVTLTATVARNAISGRDSPVGTVQFILNEKNVGQPVRLDANGLATWKTASLPAGEHQVAARYTPGNGSAYLGSTSVTRRYTVKGRVNRRDAGGAGTARPATPEVGPLLQLPGR